MSKAKEKKFTHPEWERIWTELNKLVEDAPVEEVEARWEELKEQGFQLASDLATLADNIEASIEMMQNERDHQLDMWDDMLPD